MAKFEESSLFQALTAEDKTKESILSALGSAAVDLSLRSSNGQTYIHLAATHLSSLDVPEAWEILLSKCSMFVRDSSGVSGLSAMIDGLQYAMFTKYVKSYLIAVGSDDDRKKNFMQQAVLSGKTLHLKQLARVAKADKSLIEMLQDMVALEEDLMEAHKIIRSGSHSAEVVSALNNQKMTVGDLVGLPPLHIATVCGNKDSVAALVMHFLDSLNAVDAIGRTALHYAVCMKGEVAEAIVKILTDAKADEQIKDINGLDVTAMKADPLDMEAFVASYESNLLKQSSSEMIYKVHDSVLSGDLRTVKMSLNRRELAVMPDASKLTPLHKAVILKHTAIALWIAEQFKTTMDIREGSGLTPMHFAAAVDKELYESLKKAGGDCHTVDREGNDPEYYKDHSSDFILDIDALREELLVTPPSRPATAVSERAKSAKAAGTPDTSAPARPAAAAPAPVIMAATKKAPPPETLDAKYIAEVLGTPLTAALAEVAEKRPWDPIEYLAQWLYKHKSNLNFHQRQIDAVKEAEMEEQRKVEEEENRIRRRKEAVELRELEMERQKKAEEEAKKQREQEERQRKAKESISLAQPPELATVAEDEETTDHVISAVSPRTLTEKDESGRTALHTMVTSDGSAENISALLSSSGPDLLTERDSDGRTARDLALSDEVRQCLDDYVLNLLKSSDISTLTKLMENGYPLDSINTEGQELPEPSTEFLSKVAQFSDTVAKMCTVIKTGDLIAVKEHLDKKSVAVTRLNSHGAVSLHLAVLYEKPEVVQYLVTSFPGLVDIRDHMNRTALHYAQSISGDAEREAIVKILVEGKSDPEAADCKGRKPEEYKGLGEEMAAMKEAGEVAEQAPADTSQPPADTEQVPAGDAEQAAVADEAPAAEQAAVADEAPAADEPPAAE